MSDIKFLFKELIAGGSLPEVFEKIEENLRKDSSQYDNFLLLVSSHRDIDQRVIAGTLSTADEMIFISQLRGRLMKFIDGLTKHDLKTEFHQKSEVEFGQSDLPVGILLAMGQMNPDIMSKRFATYKEMLRESRDSLLCASELKEELATKAFKKLKLFQRSKSSDKRLLNRYVKSFGDSFKELDEALINMSNIIKIVSRDHTALCLYNIQLAIANQGVKLQDINEVIEMTSGFISNFDQLDKKLQDKIEKEKALLAHPSGDIINYRKSLLRSIKAKEQFSMAASNRKIQAQYLIDALSSMQLKSAN